MLQAFGGKSTTPSSGQSDRIDYGFKLRGSAIEEDATFTREPPTFDPTSLYMGNARKNTRTFVVPNLVWTTSIIFSVPLENPGTSFVPDRAD